MPSCHLRACWTAAADGDHLFAVCGSAYGIEEAVSAGGPLLAIGTLLGVTLVWSLPMVLVVSELCACRA